MTDTSGRKPGQQRLSEWENLDDDGYRYHNVQWDTPKHSTIAFEAFAKEHIASSKNLIDMDAGTGASTASIAEKHKNVHFTAFDYSRELVDIGSKIACERGLKKSIFSTR